VINTKKAYHDRYNDITKPFAYKYKTQYSNETAEEKAERIRSSHRESKRKQYQKARSYVWQYKNAHPCEECGEDHPACLIFHHKDPDTKNKDVCKIIKSGIKATKREIAKCAVLCQNCHMKLHYKEQGEEDSKWIHDFEDLPKPDNRK
jgi:hypothetical protein